MPALLLLLLLFYLFLLLGLLDTPIQHTPLPIPALRGRRSPSKPSLDNGPGPTHLHVACISALPPPSPEEIRRNRSDDGVGEKKDVRMLSHGDDDDDTHGSGPQPSLTPDLRGKNKNSSACTPRRRRRKFCMQDIVGISSIDVGRIHNYSSRRCTTMVLYITQKTCSMLALRLVAFLVSGGASYFHATSPNTATAPPLDTTISRVSHMCCGLFLLLLFFYAHDTTRVSMQRGKKKAKSPPMVVGIALHLQNGAPRPPISGPKPGSAQANMSDLLPRTVVGCIGNQDDAIPNLSPPQRYHSKTKHGEEEEEEKATRTSSSTIIIIVI
ncbi:hypothetical protein B0I35DRAFT_175143 [Stachybotrys elegans]|uniref:Uncharacterized protein n=1 Tax=Stachybotrys elegans TaxID=80388 RepID=A0A8K0SY54_9HYPO|nr:hypothetical protein B0I35DRAFT_175143 [Stachybotrys elegans]